LEREVPRDHEDSLATILNNIKKELEELR